ncbi:MAG: ABC transporter substrate-binding protein [Chloroflexi bacterium]|nr:ABC transporter substrate-binding protein [Chloroflexota bacterium]
MRALGQKGIMILGVLLLVPMLMMACGGSSDDNGDLTLPPDGTETPPLTKITIGNLTDKTGVASNALSVIDKALEDMVEYANEQAMIPGVELDIEIYDGQWDPSKDIPGYEWLREKGADLIWTPVPPAVETLQTKVNDDQFVLFAATANIDLKELAGGYEFSLGITPEYEAYTLLKWIVENDPDFPQDRPARIGGASWLDGYSAIWFAAAENYAEVHPDQFEWVEGYLNEFSFIWDVEIEGLKDCDYVFVPTPMHKFVEDYRRAGYTQAKFVGSDVPAAFLGMIDQAELWDEIDGMLFTRSSQWYNEEGLIIDLTNKLLNEEHPSSAEDIRRMGSGYLSGQQIYMMIEIIKNAVETVGPENFNSEALFDAATSFSFTLDGVENFASFDETKRYAQNYYGIYEARADGENLFRADPEWHEQIFTP